ncbi:MAG: c-type cytochrome [Bacteroidota bacterium]|nr:c-type cytochrome [Bacteroidota bacterium]
MKNKIIVSTGIILSLFIWACGGSDSNNTASSEAPSSTEVSNDEKGIGSVKHVELTNPLDPAMIESGKGVYNLKCSACHRLTKEKLVGPGWLGVTQRRKPEWIMNFAINADEMLNKDATAMALLEECLVRMPNQNLTEADARNVLEFMRNNDGEK